MEDFSGIVEVVESGRWVCNYYLSRGYRLLAIAQTSRDRTRPDGQLYIQRSMTYVMGRTGEIEHVEYPTREQQAAMR